MRGWLLLLVLASLAGCARSGHGEGAPPSPADAPPTPATVAAEQSSDSPTPPRASLPRAAGVAAPSLLELTEGDGLDGGTLADDAARCATCHAEIAEQWRSSAHASASFDNPIYRASVEGYRESVGRKASRFCGGCHDPALLIDGAMDDAVRPDDPRAHVGVSCLLCHSVESATLDGNASYRLRRDAVPMPVEGDAASLAAHRARLSLRTEQTEHLCAACHRGFLGPETGHGHHVVGIDDVGPWLSSVYAGSRQQRVDADVAAKDCRGCHMPEVAWPAAAARKTLRSHRFAGGHSWLAAMRHDEAQLKVVQAKLRGAASIDVVALRLADGRRLWLPWEAGQWNGDAADQAELEVVVTNQAVGHQFPGGTRDIQNVWIEVRVEDAEGQLVAQSGARPGEPIREQGGPQGTHRLFAAIIDEHGHPVLAHQVQHFRTVAYDHTVAPRDRALVRYGLTLSRETKWPVTLSVRLLHHSREPATVKASCVESRSVRGRAFAAAQRARGEVVVDGCTPPPLTVIAEQRLQLGPGAPSSGAAAGLGASMSSLAAAERLLDHGAAWVHALPEQLDEGRASLERALALASSDELHARADAARVRAAACHQLALLAARQGRVDEALVWAARGEPDAPKHAALARARGTALSSVWRYEESLDWLRMAADQSPRDDASWSDYATALGSTGRFSAALAATWRGLEVAPRHADLLRVQALALRQLPTPTAVRRQAEEAFLRHRVRDDGSALRSRCSMEVVGCAQERTPVHLHSLSLP